MGIAVFTWHVVGNTCQTEWSLLALAKLSARRYPMQDNEQERRRTNESAG